MTRKRPLANRKPHKTRINAKVRLLLQHLVLDGWTIEKSAAECGWSVDWAIRLMRRADILALRKELLNGLLSATASRAGKTIDQILTDAKSDAVRLDAAQFVLGVEGIAPVSKSEAVVLHQGHVPGLTIVFSERPRPEMLDVTPSTDPVALERRKLIESLPRPVPHPTMSKRGGE